MTLGGAWRPVATAVLASAVVAGGISAGGAVGSLLGAPAPAHAASAFVWLSGWWTGSGHMRLENGAREAVGCRASYAPRRGGTALGLSLRCASASGRIELRARLTSRGRRVSGTWEERSYGLSGNVSGTASDGRLRLRFDGSLSGTLLVTASGRSQSISVRTDASALRAVSVRLRRR